MNPVSMAGAFVVTFALLSYGIGSITLQRFKIIAPGVLIFLTAGIILDILATALMIIGSQNTPFTIHGFLGYSALLAMLIDVVLVWRNRIKEGIDSAVGKKLLWYSKLAYGWWIIVYITGSVLVIWK